jgi:hypothetical protein
MKISQALQFVFYSYGQYLNIIDKMGIYVIQIKNNFFGNLQKVIILSAMNWPC